MYQQQLILFSSTLYNYLTIHKFDRTQGNKSQISDKNQRNNSLKKFLFASLIFIRIFAVANGEKSVCRKKAHFRLIPIRETGHFTNESKE